MGPTEWLISCGFSILPPFKDLSLRYTKTEYLPGVVGEFHDKFAERNEGGLEKHLASLPPPTSWLMHTDAILERLWESESSIGPDYVKCRTEEVVIRVVSEVRDDDRGDPVPVT